MSNYSLELAIKTDGKIKNNRPDIVIKNLKKNHAY